MRPWIFTMLPLLHSTRRATFMCRLVLPMAVHASSTVTVPVKVFGPVDVKSAINGFAGCPSCCAVPVQWPVKSKGTMVA